MESKFIIPRSAAFEGTPLSDAFKQLIGLDWQQTEFAVSGSAALYMLSTTAMSRGYERLISRTPNDLDILVVGEARDKALDIGIRTESNIGRGFLISLQMKDGKADQLDVTSCWPVGPEVEAARGLSGITHEVQGLRVMEEQWVLELKSKFNRPKDRSDIAQTTKALFKAHFKKDAPHR
ncbi:MAG: hypothetical protein K2X00_23415 [Nitrospiraceae bacterium]|nr:hypothetical protein [Nitrospiraceae bacterium]